MVEITRRGMLGGAAMGGLLWNTAALSSESRQPPYGPAPAPLDGPELPSFRYPLGAQKTEQSTAAPPRRLMSPAFRCRTSWPAFT